MNDTAQKIRLVMELRRQGIADTRVLGAIERLPRDLFVPESFKDQAYENIALPIKQGQTISQPYVVAFMTEALKLGERMKVLEIGTGSGYQAAVLARLCRRVYTVERYRSLMREAEARFAALKIPNITGRVGDGARGWVEQAPFDRIIVTAAAAEVPAALLEQLAPDGILVIPVGDDAASQRILRLRKTASGWEEESLLPVRFVPLVGGVAEDS